MDKTNTNPQEISNVRTRVRKKEIEPLDKRKKLTVIEPTRLSLKISRCTKIVLGARLPQRVCYIIFGLLCAQSIAFGQEPADLIADGAYHTGTVARALGGAGVAALSSAESAFLNPAHLPYLRGYDVGAFRSERHTRGVGSERDWALSLVDVTKGVMLPGAFTYVSRSYDIQGYRSDQQDFALNLGDRITPNLSWGARVRYFRTVTQGRSDESLFNGGIGLLFAPMREFGIGLMADNILDSHTQTLRPVTTIGAHYLYQDFFRIRADLAFPTKSNPDRKAIIMTGLEILPRPDIAFRFGGRIDDQIKQNFLTAGLGWDGPRLGIDYAFEKRLDASDDHAHSLDLRVHF